jgi:hypothetical protein
MGIYGGGVLEEQKLILYIPARPINSLTIPWSIWLCQLDVQDRVLPS